MVQVFLLKRHSKKPIVQNGTFSFIFRTYTGTTSAPPLRPVLQMKIAILKDGKSLLHYCPYTV